MLYYRCIGEKSMSFFDWILKGVGVESEEDEKVSSASRVKGKKEKVKKEKVKRTNEDLQSDSEDRATFATNPDQFNTSNTYYNSYEKPQTQSNFGGYGSKNVVIYYPKNYTEVQNLIDFLKQGESAVMNLDGISDSEAQRILDFVSGAVYALSGSIHRITGNIFILTPEGFNIMIPKQEN